MAAVTKKSARATAPKPTPALQDVLARLKELASPEVLAGMARFAIPSDNAIGVAMKDIKALGTGIGRHQDLASALWDTGMYEARTLAAFTGDPRRITEDEMDRWRASFDNWAICDTLCFHLFDRTPWAWKKVAGWSTLDDEFGKRAAFALLWSLTVHDKAASNDLFLDGLARIEKASGDPRNFVKKAVNMALRAIGKRNSVLREAAITLSRKLAASPDATARWIGKDALRELDPPAASRRA